MHNFGKLRNRCRLSKALTSIFSIGHSRSSNRRIKLYVEAEPLIDEAMKELQNCRARAAQILIDVIGHHINHGRSPAEAAEAVRTALNRSIKSVAQDRWIDQRG